MKRRDFLYAGVGLGFGGLTASLWLGSFLREKKLNDYEVRREACFPVVRSHYATGEIPILNLQGVNFDSDPLVVQRSYPNYVAVIFYREDGELLWREIYELASLSSRAIQIPDLRATGSLHIAFATSAEVQVYPQSEVGAYLRMRTRWGSDGHHSIGCPLDGKMMDVRHLVAAPREGEGVVIGVYNPHPHSLTGEFRLSDETGRIVLQFEEVWPAHGTRYLSLGETASDFPVHRNLRQVEAQAYLIQAASPDGTLLHASWMFSNQSFAMSHGFSFSPGVDLATPRPLASTAVSLFRDLPHLTSLQRSEGAEHWMLGDLDVHGRLDSQSRQAWSSQSFIPNLSSAEVEMNMLSFDETGRLMGEMLSQTVNAGGIGIFKSRDLGNPVRSMICHPGQGSWPNTLSKILSRSDQGLFFIQHFRPGELFSSPALIAARRHVMGGWHSDYWISGFEAGHEQVQIFIRNFSSRDTGDLRLQILNASGLEKELRLQSLAGGCAHRIPLELVNSGGDFRAIRVLSEKSPVKLAALCRDQRGRYCALHGTQRVAWLRS